MEDAKIATDIAEAITRLEALGYRVMPPVDLSESGARFQRMLDKGQDIPAEGDELRRSPSPAAVDDVHRLGDSLPVPDFEGLRRRAVGVPSEKFLPRRPPRVKIGQEVTDPTTDKRWRVTDVGSRTFTAICLSDAAVVADPSWANGPPYAIVEHVWDETWYGVLRDVPGIDWT